MEFFIAIVTFFYLLTVWAMLYVSQREASASRRQLEDIAHELRKASRKNELQPPIV